MATLSMHVGEPSADHVPSHQEIKSPPSDPTAPGGSLFWRSRRERFLTIFAIATVMTIPSFAILFVANYFGNNAIMWFGAGLLVVAMIAWWVAYIVVARWMIEDLSAKLRRLRSKSRR